MLKAFSRRRAAARPATLALALTGLVALAGCDASEDSDLDRGRDLFASKCGTCHALAEAGTIQQTGPDLDAAFAQSRADGMDNDTIEGVVQGQIANPREINIPPDDPEYTRVYMPADLVTGQDAEDVSAYVASVAGVPGAAAPKLLPDQLFTERCGICHAFDDAGTTAEVGPNLTESLKSKPRGYIETQIVDPNSEIAPGFPARMPADFEQALSPDELQDLVDYLFENVDAPAGGG